MRNKVYILFALFLLLFGGLYAQTFLNGSFENTSSPNSCNYNLSDPSFNSFMPFTNAYGPGNELDIIVNGCYTVGIPNGLYCIGVAADPSDAFTMQLSTPLVSGTTHTFTFWSYSDITFRVQGNVEIGASTNNSSFGTLIFTAATVPNTWVFHTVTFVAPGTITNISVRNVAGAIHWNRVDNFVMSAPLPVELLTFDANLDGEQVLLTWETASEINNDYFTLEKSTDAINFTEFARVDGAGNSNEEIHYKSTDFDPSVGINYYRLKQTDFDGKFEYSPIKSVIIEPKANIEVYPNPSNGNLTVEATNVMVDEIKIMNSWGELVRTVQMNETMLDISDLANGVYFIHIQTGEKTVVKRVVKQ